MIPYARQNVGEDDVAAVVEVLRGDWLTQGPTVEAFEAAVADRVEARFAVAFSSGSAGLHGAAAAGDVGPGDLTVTSSLSFVASANCARHVGAAVEFADIDPTTLNLDPTKITEAASVLIAVHYAGLPMDLGALPRRPRVVIEDAAHALGASTTAGPVGNCAHSDMCVFSFHPVKSVTSGEGGVVTTNSAELADRLRRFRNHGIDRSGQPEPWLYEIRDTGFNYRLSDIHAALGRSQMDKLDSFVARRNELARIYDTLLAGLPVERAPEPPPGVLHARHIYPIRVANRARVYSELRTAGVGVQVHYVPVHHQPLYRQTQGSKLPRTDHAYDELLSLPLYPGLTIDQQDHIVHALARTVSSG